MARRSHTNICAKVFNNPYLFHKIMMINVHGEIEQFFRSKPNFEAAVLRLDARLTDVRTQLLAVSPTRWNETVCGICKQESVGAGCGDRYHSIHAYHVDGPYSEYPAIHVPLCDVCQETAQACNRWCWGARIIVDGRKKIYKTGGIYREND